MAGRLMRTRQQILNDGVRPEYLNLEVLLDIRDELAAIKKGLMVIPKKEKK